MQFHGFQSPKGCIETISLAHAVPAPEPEFTPELLATSTEQPMHPAEPSLPVLTYCGFKELWGGLTHPAHLQSAALQVIPDEPGEVRYRIWIDSVRKDAPFALDRAPARFCPLEKLVEPDAAQATLSLTEAASAPRIFQMEEFLAARLAQIEGSS